MQDRLLDRLMEKVVWNGDEDECWTWEACRDGEGYGRIRVDGSLRLAHRLAYELFIGPIPDGLTIDHTCHSESDCPGGPSCPHRACVNPAHLEPVTQAENVRRGRGPEVAGARMAAKTHCPAGHPYSGDNLYIHPTTEQRVCKACKRRWARERRNKTQQPMAA